MWNSDSSKNRCSRFLVKAVILLIKPASWVRSLSWRSFLCQLRKWALYKQTLKTLDRKANSYHHCCIIKKNTMFNLDSLRHFADACLVFKVLRGLAPPTRSQFVMQKDSSGSAARATARRDWAVQYRQSKFGQTVFSVRASHYCYSLPIELGESTNYLTFNINLRWFKANKTCNHE